METVWKARLHTLLAIPLVAYLVDRGFSGPYARSLPYVRVIAMVAGGVMLLGVYWGSRLVVHHGERLRVGHSGTWMRRMAAPSLLLVAALLYLADQLVLPRLYGFFHWSLAGLTLLAAWLGSGALFLALGRDRRRIAGRLARPYTVVLLSLAVLAISLVGHRAVGRSNLRRAILFGRAGLGGKMLALSSRIGALPRPKELTPITPRERDRSPSLAHPDLRGADVVLITVDALRADRLGLFGYRRLVGKSRRSITPNMDRVFGQFTRFSRAYCSTPRTSYSLVSLLTGQPIYTLARLGERRQWPTLADVLGASLRYRTAGFYPLSVFTIDAQRFERYRSQHLGFSYFKFEDEDLSAKRRTDQVIRFLDEHVASGRKEALFIWAHYFDPHEPYRVRSGFAGFGHLAADRYDAEIAYVDQEIGRLLSAVASRRKRVLFVLTADHGEEFGEHGGANHGTSVFDEQVRVPLLFAGPGIPDRRVDLPVSLTQVAATILRLVGIRVPVSMDARADLTTLMPATPGPVAGDAAGAMTEVSHLRMYAHGHHKLVQSTRHRYAVLYDLKADPGERRPLGVDSSGPQNTRARELLGMLQQRLSRLEAAVRRQRRRLSGGGLLAGLTAASLARRRAAASALMHQAMTKGLSVREVAALKRALTQGDLEVHHRALAALAAHAVKVSAPLDRAPLKRMLERHDLPDDIRLPVALALASVRDPGAQKPLVSLLTRLHDLDSRLEVLRALGQMRKVSKESVDALCDAMEDSDTAVTAMRAVRKLAQSPSNRWLAARATPALYELLGHRPEHMGLRAEILTTLTCLGTSKALDLLARWLVIEPERSIRALGLALLARVAEGRGAPLSPEPASGASARSPQGPRTRSTGRGEADVDRVVGHLPALVQLVGGAESHGPAGACLAHRGCRLEASPVTVLLRPRPAVAGRAATLWLLVEGKTPSPPAVLLNGQVVGSGVPVSILAGEPVHSKASGKSPVACPLPGRPPLLVWRYEVPARLLGVGTTRVQLREISGVGVVVRAAAILPPPPGS